MKNIKVCIGEVCDINSDTYTDKEIPDTIQYLETGSITKNVIYSVQKLKKKECSFPSRARRKVKSNTIIYSSVRPNLEHYGIMEDPPQNYVVSTGFITLDIKDEFKSKIDPKFLYFLITRSEITEYLHRVALNNVTSYPSINPEDLSDIVLKIPENLSYQKKISSFISCFNKKISINKKIIKEIDDLSSSLFETWFLNFNFPNENNKPYLSNGGEMKFNDKLELETPISWGTKKLNEIIFESKSGDWGKDIKEKNYPFDVLCIRGSDIDSVKGLEEIDIPIRFISKKNENILSDQDIVIEMSGGSPSQSTGRALLISKKILERFKKPLICSNFCKVIKTTESNLTYYLYFFWNYIYANDVLFKFEGKTSGIKNLLFDIFTESCYISIPDDKTLSKFNNLIIENDNKKNSLLIENDFLIKSRDEFLSLIISGQIKMN